MDSPDPFPSGIQTSQPDCDGDGDCENTEEPGGEIVNPVEAHVRVWRSAFGVRRLAFDAVRSLVVFFRLRNQNDFTDVFAAFHPFVSLRRFRELENAID
jgi:hypothetical protein